MGHYYIAASLRWRCFFGGLVNRAWTGVYWMGCPRPGSESQTVAASVLLSLETFFSWYSRASLVPSLCGTKCHICFLEGAAVFLLLSTSRPASTLKLHIARSGHREARANDALSEYTGQSIKNLLLFLYLHSHGFTVIGRTTHETGTTPQTQPTWLCTTQPLRSTLIHQCAGHVHIAPGAYMLHVLRTPYTIVVPDAVEKGSCSRPIQDPTDDVPQAGFFFLCSPDGPRSGAQN